MVFCVARWLCALFALGSAWAALPKLDETASKKPHVTSKSLYLEKVFVSELLVFVFFLHSKRKITARRRLKRTFD